MLLHSELRRTCMEFAQDLASSGVGRERLGQNHNITSLKIFRSLPVPHLLLPPAASISMKLLIFSPKYIKKVGKLMPKNFLVLVGWDFTSRHANNPYSEISAPYCSSGLKIRNSPKTIWKVNRTYQKLMNAHIYLSIIEAQFFHCACVGFLVIVGALQRISGKKVNSSWSPTRCLRRSKVPKSHSLPIINPERWHFVDWS